MATQAGVLTEEIKYVRKGIVESIEKKYKTLKVDAISTLNEDFELLSKQQYIPLYIAKVKSTKN